MEETGEEPVVLRPTQQTAAAIKSREQSAADESIQAFIHEADHQKTPDLQAISTAMNNLFVDHAKSGDMMMYILANIPQSRSAYGVSLTYNRIIHALEVHKVISFEKDDPKSWSSINKT